MHSISIMHPRDIEGHGFLISQQMMPYLHQMYSIIDSMTDLKELELPARYIDIVSGFHVEKLRNVRSLSMNGNLSSMRDRNNG